MSDDPRETPDGASHFGYVFSSAVRQHLVSSLSTSERSTAGLIDESEYSDSAIYNALGDLEERGLITRRTDGRWRLSGLGQLLADWNDVAERTETLVRTDETYWQNHDVSVVPRAFRQEIHALDECEIVRSSPTKPQRVQARVTDLIRSADSVDVMTEVQHLQYAREIEERAGRASPRLLFDADLVESPDAGRYRRPDEWADEVTLWVHDHVGFTMGILGDHLVLSLPTLDGNYDMYTEIVASDDALDWGRKLFDHYFAAASPLGEYLASD